MITKEQIAKENYELKAKVETMESSDGTLRRRFAKVLGETENRFGVGSDRSPKDLSWEEIFCELGKLMAFRDFRHWRDEIEFKIQNLTPKME